ncbi:MAG TPA: ABC transporter ATP-binding protein [Candidatus Limnocylindrales bacterium]|jgi:energy-coupling factor transport system ATP-binding protein
MPALRAVDLSLAPGEILGVIGPNDSGKSTLGLVAAGLAPQAIGGRLAGSVEVGGTPTRDLRPHELAQRVGILFQNPSTQLSSTARTVWEEVAFGPRNLGLPLDEVVDWVASAIALLGIEGLAPRDPNRLSGGEGQLVALASVLALRPRVLVLDEPTSQLDPAGTVLVGAALGRLRESGTAVVLVEHKADVLQSLAGRVAVLDEGRIVAIGSTRDLLADPLLEGLGVEPPSDVRIARALQSAGLPAGLVA